VYKRQELRGPSEEELKKFPDADAWVGVFPEPVRQTQRSVAAARVRVSERRILAKTDSEVRLQLRKLKASQMTGGN